MKRYTPFFLAIGLGLAIVSPALAQGAGIPLGTIEASSSRGAYFQTSHLNDGNLTSAWGPHVDDLMPNLVFSLGRTVALSAIEIKLSPAGAAFDVEMHQNGTWRTVASGQRPQAETLARISLPNAQGDRVRLKFTGVNAGQLQVCEVRLYGEGAAWTPSPTPTPVAPVPVPPIAGSYADATGSGWILGAFDDHPGRGKGHEKGKGKGHEKGRGKGHDKHHDKAGNGRVTFSFDAHERPGRADWGRIELSDRGGQRFRGQVTDVVFQGRTATLTGTLRSGGGFTAVVTDNGRSDHFRFTTGAGYTVEGPVRGGGIQIKRRPIR